jgi:hypothetical protein
MSSNLGREPAGKLAGWAIGPHEIRIQSGDVAYVGCQRVTRQDILRLLSAMRNRQFGYDNE